MVLYPGTIFSHDNSGQRARPIAAPTNNAVLVNACESAPYRIARHVKGMDTFWIKGQPYSLRHMFADDSVYKHFIDGTIYQQAFLSALSYHRWHSPVSGTIVDADAHPWLVLLRNRCRGI